MSDDGGGLHVRQTPRTRAREAQIADFTMLVRVPGQPAAVRVYANDEQSEAARSASAPRYVAGLLRHYIDGV
jgi:hypothetical protein